MGIAFSSVPRLLRQRTPPQLPDDVVVDILSRIRVKTLCRFRCVSKGWYTLISDNIVSVYKARAEPLLVVGSRRDTSLRLIDMGGNVVKVIKNVGYVWKLICTSRDNLVCVIGISCDVKVVDLANGEVLQTCKKTGLLGFGCTIPFSVYKIVYINPYLCEILTVGDDVEWRPMQLPQNSNISYARSPVVVNGVLHLLLRSQLDGNGVLCFNLASEEWMKAIKGPPNVDLQKGDLSLSELNGSLCMVQPEDESWVTNIWLLTNSNKSTWVKVFEIPLNSRGHYRVKPLRILPDGRLVFYNTHEKTDLSSVQIYDPHNWDFIDAPNALAGVHDTNFSPCS
jgi:F-box interacting protein